MPTLARWCVRHRHSVLLGWTAALIALLAAVLTFGTGFSSATQLPHSESSTAYALLAQAGSSGTKTGSIVWHTTGVAVDDAAVQTQVASMLRDVAAQPGVVAVVSPYTPAGATHLNAAARTAFASVTTRGAVDIPAMQALADRYDTVALKVAVGGAAFAQLPTPSHGMEAVGLLAALLLLFLMFRSAWASVLPLVTGVAGVGVSLLTVVLASHVMTLDSTALTMGALIGLGVGIDYALFIVNRHRNALLAGRSVPEAAALALTTSGRAVVFAGLTVVVALLGMAVVNLSVLTSMAQAAAVTVVFTVLSALTLLPALLGLLGTRVLSKRQRAQLADASWVPATSARTTTRAFRWALRLQRSPRRMAVIASLLLATLALPVLTMRVGNADASSDPVGSPSRTYYDLMSPAFGQGVDATLVLAATVPDQASATAFDHLVADLSGVPGVAAAVGAPAKAGAVGVAAVTPTTSAQTAATSDLVNRLRNDVIPAAENGTGLHVYVGGETATNIDISNALMNRLPLYLGVVALLGFLLLAVAFRSVLVPLVGALSNLATIAVGLGVITAVFQHGWGSSLLGVGSGAPVMYIVPVILVGVVFGLSMDYQVFLVSRMHEEWTRTRDNARAVRVGVTETSRVIATAATIMLAVFASFSFGGERIVSAIGIGLGVAVIVDAFVVRLTLIPALMRLIGPRMWAYPRWADRITPRLSVEGGPDEGSDDDVASDEISAAQTSPDGARRLAAAPDGASAPLRVGTSTD